MSDLSDRDRRLLFGDDTPAPGDAVVHIEHGLARFEGTETTDLGDDGPQELTRLVYRKGGKLLLPAEQGVDYWRYGVRARDVTLDRLDADDWTKARDALIAELRSQAADIVRDERARRAETAHAVSADQNDLKAIADGFAHPLTDDQSAAIEAILSDLSREVPMNRLLIGDVGYGKTEVALRAAAVVALAGHQVAVAAPTTVLARQHAVTFRNRLSEAGLTVAELSRLVTDAERTQTLEGLASGEIDVVVGTQALLSEDVAFADLALLIVDEEQKFGEDQKDALRAVAPGLHVLALTSTPIPRSLAAAEVGLMDASLIASPPEGRPAVETLIRARSARTLITALEGGAEDGQSFVVVPRIEMLDEVSAHLADADIRHTIAHGQMDDDEMSEAVLEFMRGNVPVLLSTSIVENGLDNARADRMVIWDADLFGLGQLHQLRGRIGRGTTDARLVLLTDADMSDEDDPVARRLTALANATGPGAGFEIARLDRDQRGFGDLSGSDQSGQMSRLGIGLYRHILTSALRDEVEGADD